MQTPQSYCSKLINTQNSFSQKTNKTDSRQQFDRKILNFQALSAIKPALSERNIQQHENYKRQKISIQLKIKGKGDPQKRAKENQLQQRQCKRIVNSISTQQCSQACLSKQSSNRKMAKQRSLSIRINQPISHSELRQKDHFLDCLTQDTNWDQIIQQKKKLLYNHLYSLDKMILSLSRQSQAKQETPRKKTVNISKKKQRETEVQPINKQDMINLIRKKCQEKKNRDKQIKEIAVDLRKKRNVDTQVQKKV